MTRNSGIGLGTILKQAIKLAPHNWISSKLIKLQLEKGLFSLTQPGRHTGTAGKIRQVSIRITDICNLRCHTCGQWGDKGFLHGKDLKELKKQEIPAERYLDVFQDLVKGGHRPLVYLWGGEPMLYDGIMKLIEGVTAMGLPVAIATNGTRIAGNLDRFRKAPLFLLQVSIDGPSAGIHNRIRPSASGFDGFKEIKSSMESLRTARKEQGSALPLVASLTVISKNNFRHLAEIYEAFRENVDLFVFYLSWWIDVDNALLHEENFKRRFGYMPEKHRGWIGDWRPDDFKALDRQLNDLISRSHQRGAPPVTIIPRILGEENLRTYYTDHQARFGFNRCISIYQAVEINSNGDLSPCRDYHDHVIGNIRHSTITELWNSDAYRLFRRSLSQEGLMPACSRCCGLMGY